jgi:hypothetical protein
MSFDPNQSDTEPGILAELDGSGVSASSDELAEEIEGAPSEEAAQARTVRVGSGG